MQLRNFDLNLLTIFAAIFEEGSIVAASRRLNLSQSAISHALGRLRRALADELFVREADGMRPTVRAQQLGVAVKRALAGITSAVGGPAFNPPQSLRAFGIGASDYACTTIIPRVIERVAVEAPGVDIHVVPANRLDMVRLLEEGTIDCAIGWFATVPERFGRLKLLDEGHSYMVRKGHPLSRGNVTTERLLQFSHIAVNYLGSASGLIDGYLPERGVLRRVHMEVTALEAPQRLDKDARIAMCVPQFWCLPPILERTDMIASVPRRLASEFVKRFALVRLEDPVGPYEVAVEAIWHRRDSAEPAILWLRRQIQAAAATLQATKTRPQPPVRTCVAAPK